MPFIQLLKPFVPEKKLTVSGVGGLPGRGGLKMFHCKTLIFNQQRQTRRQLILFFADFSPYFILEADDPNQTRAKCKATAKLQTLLQSNQWTTDHSLLFTFLIWSLASQLSFIIQTFTLGFQISMAGVQKSNTLIGMVVPNKHGGGAKSKFNGANFLFFVFLHIIFFMIMYSICLTQISMGDG